MSQYSRAYYQAHKEEQKAKKKAWRESHKEVIKEYKRNDVNSSGKSKHNIRLKSNYYLKTHGKKIEGYEIHHCCTYNEPYKFIYCSKEIHLKVHNYLRQHNINADTDHYDQIKYLLDDTVVIYGLD